MKTFSIYCFCFIVFFLPGYLQGQDVPSEIVPPSPNVYSLAKYGDVPVSLYTGVPDISIPIASLIDHDLSVNVSLSYHGSGIKVDEMASWVGLGWSLNAGGVITRTVRGRTEYIGSDGSLQPERAHIDFYEGSADWEERNDFINDNLKGAASGSLDTEPDIFYFNFNGRSGKFYFNKDGKALLNKQEGIEINWEYVSGGSKFEVRDEYGNIYEFSDTEMSTYNDGTGISAWYLSKINSPEGHEITFDYYQPSSGYHYIQKKAETFVELNTSDPIIYPGSVTPELSLFSTELQIHKIISSTGEWIEFKIKPGQRLDYHSNSAYALDEIVLHRTDGILKKFKFSTSYFEANNNEKYTGVNEDILQHLNYRLRLDSIHEISGEGSALEPYKFTYHGDNNPVTDDIYTLPYRLSPSQDHWGYFNDSGNAHIFPGNSDSKSIGCNDKWYLILAPYSGGSYSNDFRNGANREPNVEAMKAGALKEIHYPTGGYTYFLFEPNEYSIWPSNEIGGGLRIGKITNYPTNGIPEETDFKYEPSGLYLNPKDHYYEFFTVGYGWDNLPLLPGEILQSYGLPIVESSDDINYVKISAQPQVKLSGTMGPQYGYEKVTVINNDNGYSENYFSNGRSFYDYHEFGVFEDLMMPQDIFLSEFITGQVVEDGAEVTRREVLHTSDWPYPEIFSNEWKRGVLYLKNIYSQDSILLREEHYKYYRQLQNTVEGFKIVGANNFVDFYYAKYYHPVGRIHLKESIITDYDEKGANPITTSTKYFYDNFSHFQLSRKEVSRSDGKKQTTLTSYPLDYLEGTPFIDSMQNNHLLAYPIEQVTYLDSGQSILSGKITQYKTDGLGLKDKEQLLQINAPLSLSSFKFSNRAEKELPPLGTPTTFLPDSLYHTRLTYHGYDSIGNILSLSKDNGYKTCYVWSYGGQFPIAKIINAEYNAVETALGGATAVINFRDKIYPSDTEVENFLLPLRNNFPDALISTYTYKPLEGMSSQTDPNGFITKYEYDEFGRLRIVKDQDDNIIKRFTYNYKDLNN